MSQVKSLLKEFSGLLDQFSDSSANGKRVSHSEPFLNRIGEQLKKFTDILPTLALKTNREEKQAIAPDCNLFLQKINRFLSQAASTGDENYRTDVHNPFLPGITNLLVVLIKFMIFKDTLLMDCPPQHLRD